MTDTTAGKILIVDDDEGHGEALGDGLEIDGYECVVVASGEAGVSALEGDAFDAVLTDLVMHDRSGLEVLQEAKRLTPDTPVLLITGHATVETAVDAMREGAEDYLSKPVKTWGVYDLAPAHEYVPFSCDPEASSAHLEYE